jgi:hypothetical protein
VDPLHVSSHLILRELTKDTLISAVLQKRIQGLEKLICIRS